MISTLTAALWRPNLMQSRALPPIIISPKLGGPRPFQDGRLRAERSCQKGLSTAGSLRSIGFRVTPMATAFPNISGEVFVLTAATLARGHAAAAASPRRRIILPLHRGQDAPVQRMLNFLQPGTYIQPHCHPLPGASETLQMLSGRIGFILFDRDGRVSETHVLEGVNQGLIDIEPHVWHGFVVLQTDSAVLEIKRGPYDPAHDKVFADWAPAEGDPGTDGYLETLAALF